LEGVAFAFRDSLNAMTSTGTTPAQLTAVGGGSRSTYWLQSIATTLNLPISVPEDGDFGAAFGAARLGMMAAGHGGADLATPPKIREIIEPDPALTNAFADTYHRYTSAYSALKELT
jgi:xylulokinase